MLLCTGVSALVLSGQAMAQSTESPNGNSNEVVVTARFKTEKLQNVGESVQVLSRTDIRVRGITDFADIVAQTPGLNFTNRGPDASTPSIRGLATLAPIQDTLTTPQLIGIYYDDVPVTVPFTSQRDVPLDDISRIEVLRGPQGTLYGEGSMGGAIRYLSTDPSLTKTFGDISATGNGIAGRGAGYDINGSVDVPVVQDHLGIGISAWDRDDNGFIDFPTAHKNDGNAYRDTGVHVVALADVTDDLSVRVSAFRDVARLDGDWTVTGNANDLVNTLRPFMSLTNDTADLVATRVAYTQPFGTFQTTFGYYDREWDRNGFDASIAEEFAPYAAFLPAIDPDQMLNNRLVNYSNESRFVSSLNGPINFVVGFFYKNANYTTAQHETFPGAAILYGTPTLYTIHYNDIQSQTAEFGEIYYNPIQNLKFTAGLREINLQITDHLVAAQGPFFPTALNFVNKATFSRLLPKFAVEYKVTPDILLYASASQGARSGGLNSPVSIADLPVAQQASARTYAPDSVWAYEAGIKTSWLDHRLTADLSGYYNDWHDAQVTLLTPNVGYGYFANVGSVHITGLEAEVRGNLDHGVTLFGTFGITDARTATKLVLGGPGGTVVPSGSAIPYVAFMTGSLGGQWTTRLSEGFDLTTEADYTYTDGAPVALGDLDHTQALGQLDLRLTLAHGPISGTVFASNVTNQIKETAASAVIAERYINRPRTVGVTLRYDYQ
jgi:iron complex outermembrane receptor protein